MARTLDEAKRIVAVVDAGLVRGLGKPVPGQMCVEAAICYALGLPHGDDPQCVDPAVRAFKLVLNDAEWISPHARAAGLRALAIAQLDSKGAIDSVEFARRLAKQTIQVIVPMALRVAGLESEARRCEEEGTGAAAEADDAMLVRSADIALTILRDLGAPGVALWDALNQQEA